MSQCHDDYEAEPGYEVGAVAPSTPMGPVVVIQCHDENPEVEAEVEAETRAEAEVGAGA